MGRDEMKYIIGLTGKSGSGKTTVSHFLKENGATIIDADEIAHAVLEKGTPAYEEIVRYYGQRIIREDGQINRKKLGDIVFSNINERMILNEITHPRIKETIQDAVSGTTGLIVIDAALLLQSGLHQICDEIWIIKARPELCVERIIKRDMLTLKQATDRLSVQDYAHIPQIRNSYVFENSNTIEALKVIVEQRLSQIKKEF